MKYMAKGMKKIIKRDRAKRNMNVILFMALCIGLFWFGLPIGAEASRIYQYRYEYVLSPEQRELYVDIMELLKGTYDRDFEENCYIGRVKTELTEQDSKYTAYAVFDDNPQMFHVSSRIGYDGVDGYLYFYCEPDFRLRISRSMVQQTLDIHVRLLENVSRCMGTRDKAVYILNYLCDMQKYAVDSVGGTDCTVFTTTVAGVLGNRSVCSGYAKLYAYLAAELGLKVFYVSGYVSEGYHAWNYILLDDGYYMLDATFHDADRSGKWCLRGKSALTSHVPSPVGINADGCAGYVMPELVDDTDVSNNDVLGNSGELADFWQGDSRSEWSNVQDTFPDSQDMVSGLQDTVFDSHDTFSDTQDTGFAELLTAMDWEQKAIQAKNQGDYTGAIQCYDKAIQYDSGDYTLLVNLGSLYEYDLSDYESAMDAYVRATGINEVAIWNAKACGDKLMQVGKQDKLFQYYEKLSQICPNDAELLRQLGVWSAIWYEDYETAVWYLEKAVALDPDNADFNWLLQDYKEKENELYA